VTTAIYDVIVAGFGYGGAHATRLLSANGLKVLAVDRRGRAGYPPQSTSGIAAAFARRYGLPVGEESAPITSFHIYGPEGTEATLGTNLFGELGEVMVEPDVLGKIEKECENNGSEVLHSSGVHAPIRKDGQWHVSIRGEVGDFTAAAPYLIDATGYLAWVGRAAGLLPDFDPEDVHGGVEQTVPLPADHPAGEVRMWLGHTTAPDGYCWAFPSKEEGRPMVRVGVGVPRRVPMLRSGNPGPVRWYPVPAKCQNAQYWLTGFLQAHPEYQGRVHHRCGGQIPTSAPHPRPYHEGLFLIGDSARLCCPISGAGVMTALESARCAAVAITTRQGFDAVGRCYLDGLRPLQEEMRRRYTLKQLFYGLSDHEIAQLVRVMDRHTVRDGEVVEPLRIRRRLTRNLLLSHPGIALSLLTRGRWGRARHPWRPAKVVVG
jgi:flavin-dependent dehydrogenase